MAEGQPQTATGGSSVGAMGQGEALINVRSDVKLAIRGTSGTRPEYVEQLSKVISDQMGATRACYAKIVRTRPATVGGLSMRVTLEEGKKKPRHEFEEQEGSDEQLTSCIKKVFRKQRYKGVGRPAAAVITLTFQNSRAAGQQAMTKHRVESDDVTVRHSDGGDFEASYKTPDGRVAFHVSSPKSEQAVEATTRTLRSSFAAFLDCRRRAQKDGLSPAGEVDVAVRLQAGGKASGKVKSSTVAHERVIPCIERAFRRLKFKGAPAGRAVQVRVTYAE
jgi:hypothetical protein